MASVPLDHYDQVTNPLLATLPLFTLAGYIVAASGAARRLVRLLRAWSGHLRGGPAVVTVLACAFFTAFTGGSGVTILALGGLLMPILLSFRVIANSAALGLVTGAGSLGVLFAPCLPLILYSIVAQVSDDDHVPRRRGAGAADGRAGLRLGHRRVASRRSAAGVSAGAART